MLLLLRTAIVGSGAVGLYYGVKLALNGSDVHFLLRSDFSAARRQGIHIVSNEGDLILKEGNFYLSSAAIGPVDLVLISLKTTANEALREILPPLLTEQTWLLTLQNGLGNEDFLRQSFHTDRVLGGLCFVCLNRTAPARVEHLGYGTVTLGDTASQIRPVIHQLANAFDRSGISNRVAPDLNSARWEKLLWNIPFNGLTITEGSVPVSALLASAGSRRRIEILMRETIAAANANGCNLSDHLVNSLIERTETMGDYHPSSLVDFALGRDLELESIWGEPLRRGEGKGIAMPELRKLYSLLQERVAGRFSTKKASQL